MRMRTSCSYFVRELSLLVGVPLGMRVEAAAGVYLWCVLMVAGCLPDRCVLSACFHSSVLAPQQSGGLGPLPDYKAIKMCAGAANAPVHTLQHAAMRLCVCFY
jgi:hypothetical protein